MPQYRNIKAAPEAYAALERFALDTSARVGRRVTLGEAIALAVLVADQHRPDVDRAAVR